MDPPQGYSEGPSGDEEELLCMIREESSEEESSASDDDIYGVARCDGSCDRLADDRYMDVPAQLRQNPGVGGSKSERWFSASVFAMEGFGGSILAKCVLVDQH